MENSNINGLGFNEIISLILNHKIEIVLFVIIFTIIGYGYTMNLVTPLYSSSTTLVLVSQPKMNSNNTEESNDSITDSDINLNSKLVSTYSEIITSKAVLRQVKTNLKIDTAESVLKKNIKVKAVKDSGILEISVTSDDAEKAAQIANEVAKAFSEKIETLYKMDNVQVLDVAEVDNHPSNINHKKDVVLFMLIGATCSMIYVFLFSLLDTTVKATDDLERKYKVPVLASVPLYTTSTSKKKGDA